MNNIGDIKTGREIWGSKNNHKFIWCACENCGHERWVLVVKGKPTSRWCNGCAIRKPRRGKEQVCPICGSKFYCSPSSNKIYCSKQCANQALLKGENLICRVCGKEYHRSPYHIKRSVRSFCSNKCKGQFIALAQVGKLNPQWKGGISTENHRTRASQRWKDWRKAVFERDDFTCRDCGVRSSKGHPVTLHPHHIQPFSKYLDLRFEVNNGITLCEDCHRRHTAWQRLNRLIH